MFNCWQSNQASQYPQQPAYQAAMDSSCYRFHFENSENQHERDDIHTPTPLTSRGVSVAPTSRGGPLPWPHMGDPLPWLLMEGPLSRLLVEGPPSQLLMEGLSSRLLVGDPLPQLFMGGLLPRFLVLFRFPMEAPSLQVHVRYPVSVLVADLFQRSMVRPLMQP